MKLLPVSALSSWVHCPRQFYLAYVLKKEEPPKDVMILGLIKHKLHEYISNNNRALITHFKPQDNPQERLQHAYTELLQKIIRAHRYALKRVNVTPHDAFRSAVPLTRFEATATANTITPLLRQGLTGEKLWDSITPKVKTEYSVKSTTLGLKGRIDRLECYENNLVPVELKSGKAPQDGIWDTHRVQAAAYALMLEDTFKTSVPTSIVHYIDHDSKRELVMNPYLKEQVTDTIAQLRACLASQELPNGCGRENCPSCRFFVQHQ